MIIISCRLLDSHLKKKEKEKNYAGDNVCFRGYYKPEVIGNNFRTFLCFSKSLKMSINFILYIHIYQRHFGIELP